MKNFKKIKLVLVGLLSLTVVQSSLKGVRAPQPLVIGSPEEITKLRKTWKTKMIENLSDDKRKIYEEKKARGEIEETDDPFCIDLGRGLMCM